jgi:hypothetical protein
MLLRNVLLYGREEPLPAVIPLRAGPLSLWFTEGDLRYVRCGGREVVRRIYAAVRDANWGTIAGVISGLKVESAEDSFRITYESEHRQGGIHFRWTAAIIGTPDGGLTFSFAGQALTTFRRNRIGLCVHHPLEGCAGRPCLVEKVDGAIERGVFPRYAAPHQPFLNLRAVSHEAHPGLMAEVRFEGDVFEMEDHRNWTDAGFKTYSTPLSLPFPVEVKVGTEIRQSVRLTLKGKPPAHAATCRNCAVSLSFSKESKPLPAIGLGLASHDDPLGEKEIARLKALRLAHLRADAASLERALREAAALGVPLEVAVMLGGDPEAELKALAARVRELRPRIARWLIFHAKEAASSSRWAALARRYLPAAPLLVGTDANFAELNRNRPEPKGIDGVCFSVNPQVHAFDNFSLAENCAAQAEAVESARQFAAGLPVCVSPVTLKRRFNAVTTVAEVPLPPGELPPQVDPRQMSLFGAVWTLASLKHLSVGGAAAVTFYETTGWRGVMETAQGSPLPRRFRSIPDGVFPLWHVLAAAGEFAGGETVLSSSAEPLAVESLVLRKPGRVRALVANLTASEQVLRMPASLFRRGAAMWSLDETSAEAAMTAPESFQSSPGRPLKPEGPWLRLTLLPYALLRIDSPVAQRRSP